MCDRFIILTQCQKIPLHLIPTDPLVPQVRGLHEDEEDPQGADPRAGECRLEDLPGAGCHRADLQGLLHEAACQVAAAHQAAHQAAACLPDAAPGQTHAACLREAAKDLVACQAEAALLDRGLLAGP